MNNLSFLEMLFRTKGYQKVMDLIIAERERIITYEEFLYVLNEVNVVKDLADCDYYSISGSGGSGIIKPNISTIACLYLSQFKDIKVIKIGSKAKSSASGSTDCIQYNKIYVSTIEQLNNSNNGFIYFDVDSISPWKKYCSIWALNKSLKDIIDGYVFNEIKYKGKLTGIRSYEMINDYLNRKHINKPDILYAYQGKINEKYIDEFVPGMNSIYGINHQSEEIYINDHVKYVKLSKSDVFSINKKLILGILDEGYWYESLKYTVAIALYKFKKVESLAEGIDAFKKIYN